MKVTSSQRCRITVGGTVQGVGFRPFVHRLAEQLDLGGWVANTADGALIEVEGPTTRVAAFLERLTSEAPVSATVTTVATQLVPEEGQVTFSIRSSDTAGSIRLVVSSDLATCVNCARELKDPKDRRFRYPFLTCTQCGPRYSVVTGIPYDRCSTTMHKFSLCASCQGEYDDPSDRRYHAESIACPACGPDVAFWDDRGQTVARGEAALEKACAVVRTGDILAVKGLGGFQLWVDARSESAVQRLRSRKRRPHKPFAVLFPSLAAARAACRISHDEEHYLCSPQAPILVLPRRPDARLAEAIAPGNPTVGAMLPYTPLHLRLMDELQFSVIATSGNRSEEPIATDEAEAHERLSGIADAFLVHNRPIARAVDDSVIRFAEKQPIVLRRARGYAPLPIYIQGEVRDGRPLPPILGVGGHLKNTISLSFGEQVVLSQHIGDLSTVESFRAFRGAVNDLQDLTNRKPVAIACDLHPDYRSSLFAADLAKNLKLPLFKIQHHHAHVAACMAEHGLNGEVLGVAWDGSGYGTDGALWGGEFLVAGYGSFKRAAHLLPFPLLGGEQAFRELRRSALSLLWETFGDEALSKDWPAAQGFGPEWETLTALLRNGATMQITTSMGRLFDGVASITGLCQVASFEGQGAIAVQLAAERFEEMRAERLDSAPLGYQIPLRSPRAEAGLPVADWRPLVQQILYDVSLGMSPTSIAYSFHQALADLVQSVAERTALPRVVLTGGCFQNVLLVRLVRHRLEQAGFTVYTHQQVPPNDGGLALGQVMIAGHQLVRSKG